MKMIVADIKEFISGKFCHPTFSFSDNIYKGYINVLKSNVIEFYLFLTTSSIDLMPPEFYQNFIRIYPQKFSWFYSYNLHDAINQQAMTSDFTYFRNKGVIFICICSSEKDIYQISNNDTISH